MEGAVKERVQARHATECDDSVPTADPPERSDRERDAEEPQRPHTGFIGEIAEGIDAERTGVRSPSQPNGWSQRCQKGNGLEQKANRAVGHDVQ